MAIPTMRLSHFPLIQRTNMNPNNLPIRSRHDAIDTPPSKPPLNHGALRLAESFSKLLHLHLVTSSSSMNFPRSDWCLNIEEKAKTSATSPKENISEKWHEIHGSFDWEDLLNPLHPWLRREIIKYGEFAQATYDAFDFDSFSEFCGSCRFDKDKLFHKLSLSKNGYNVTKYLYAMSHIDVPQWLERSPLIETWSKDSNWMGYVSVSDDDETRRIGRRDIVVAWRGTVAPTEWFEDFQRKLEPIGDEDHAKVEHGFLSIYTSKNKFSRYNKSSASEQVMKEIKRLVKFYRERGEEVSLTITGHSLGGALALLNAYEAASAIGNIPVSVISFGAPRVGNNGFKEELEEKGVKVLRVVTKQDLVPKMPGIVFNESLQMLEEITGNLEWIYTHVGTELKLDIKSSPYLKHGINLVGFHSLETYLHLVDGFIDTTAVAGAEMFRSDARRDVALVNKWCNMLVDELRIPNCWYQLANKGLVRNDHGRWVKPPREWEDIPSPIEKHSVAA